MGFLDISCFRAGSGADEGHQGGAPGAVQEPHRGTACRGGFDRLLHPQAAWFQVSSCFHGCV